MDLIHKDVIVLFQTDGIPARDFLSFPGLNGQLAGFGDIQLPDFFPDFHLAGVELSAMHN